MVKYFLQKDQDSSISETFAFQLIRFFKCTQLKQEIQAIEGVEAFIFFSQTPQTSTQFFYINHAIDWNWRYTVKGVTA